MTEWMKSTFSERTGAIATFSDKKNRAIKGVSKSRNETLNGRAVGRDPQWNARGIDGGQGHHKRHDSSPSAFYSFLKSKQRILGSLEPSGSAVL